MIHDICQEKAAAAVLHMTVEPFHPDLERLGGANDVYLEMEREGRAARVLQCSVWGAVCW